MRPADNPRKAAKPGADQGQGLDRLGQQEGPRPAFSPKHRQPFAGVFPEPAVGGELVERPQQPLVELVQRNGPLAAVRRI
jgi:hypothetical protein